MAFASIRNWGIEHAVFVGATAATVYGAVTGRERVQQAAKPLMAPALAVRVLRRRGDLDTADATLLVAGLAAATVGDVFMIDPDVDARLRRGATSFGVMQMSYSSLLTRRGARPRLAAALPRLGAWLGVSGLLRAKAPAVAQTLTGYGALLGTTATLAADPALAPGAADIAGLPMPNRRDRRSWLGLGGLLFTGSDGLIVMRKLFLRGEKPRAAAEGVILASYAAAQLLLVEGMLALGHRAKAQRL
ncbi:lysoplasmalogenase [Rhodococcus sp. ABRD24]|uniref:lysoplasmalogenase family protein n=1 Tax=Rhodococcus sp. ABRD24 TaxID=2507582 RepID=UPI00103AFEC8|nr:lysoplasmalogenase family protein [Rhodococcus sp. ABRD24]QBJ98610.1 lysoplasmalogenase [Rhodococcus sp. ABRD24]